MNAQINNRWSGRAWVAVMLVGTLLFSGCGGGGGADPAPNTPAAEIAPVITAQPSDAQTTAGGGATFVVAATGNSLRYQWQRSADAGANWSNVSAATAATLTLTSVSLSQSGEMYRVRVSGVSLEVISSPVQLRVVAAVQAPVIAVGPADVTVTAGASARFAVTAEGTNLVYAWQQSAGGVEWTAVADATAATLTIAAADRTLDGRRYRVVVSNTVSAVTSAAATLTVVPAAALPSFVSQPTHVTVSQGAAALFSAQAAGEPAPTYQWQRSAAGGASFVDISGASAASFSLRSASLADNGALFRVVASNASGRVVSDAATLTVTSTATAPSFTSQPSDVSVQIGQTARWTATASGSPTPTYQWQLSTDGGASFTNLAGANGSSFEITSVAAADDGKQIRLLASNDAGTSTSRAATLTVSSPGTGSATCDVATDVGQALATQYTCVACHSANSRLVGPSYREIAQRYACDATNIQLLSTRVRNGGAGVWGPVPMPANPAPTDDHISTLVRWILSHR